MLVSIIVAASENNTIGKNNQLPWHLPDDLKYFKKLTMGHHIIMGRKTYESIGKPLPGRTSVIITRSMDYKAEGCVVKNTLKDAIEFCKNQNETEAFVIGGAEIINLSEKLADKIYLTKVHAQVEGDVFLNLNNSSWIESEKTYHPKDEKHIYDFSFLTLERK